MNDRNGYLQKSATTSRAWVHGSFEGYSSYPQLVVADLAVLQLKSP
ncbi:MAG: hypothetical protein PVI42_11905 [Desulfobacterales bacterium]